MEKRKAYRHTKESFVEKAKSIHGDKYSYDLVDYKNIRTKVVITCPIHGNFEQTPKSHMNGQGCPICGKLKANSLFDNQYRKNHRKTAEEFQSELKEKFGDKYTLLSEFKGMREPIRVFCNAIDENGVPHGEILTRADYLLSGHGCEKCGRKKFRDTIKQRQKKPKKPRIKKVNPRIVSFEKFEERLKNIAGDKLSVSREDFKNMNTRMKVVCNECGHVFYRTPTFLTLNKQSCPECNKKRLSVERTKTTKEFIRQASEIHNGYYSYEKTVYTSSSDKVVVTCPEHGDFLIEANSHLQGHGCPMHYCNKSKQEIEIQEFVANCIGAENCVFNTRQVLPTNKELDVYIPSMNIAIEYDGLFWHCEVKKDNKYHLDKTNECASIGINLIHIFEDEWIYKKEIVKSMLLNKFGLTSERIYARSCIVKEVSSEESGKFLDKNHIQGKCGGRYRIGLFYKDELVSIMVFGTSRHFVGNKEKKWELIRFANKCNTTVVGGASKLFKYFLDIVNPESVVSYSDKRFSQGNLYYKLGFVKYNESRPNYYYILGDKRLYRFNFRKEILIKKYGCDPKTSERDFCRSQKWYRIYDCGCLCFEWKKN